MIEGTAGLSRYRDIVLGSEFSQARLLTPDKFIEDLRERGIHLCKNRLEFYDNKGLLRPVLRCKESVPKEPKDKGVKRSITATTTQANRHKVEFPKDGDYQPWKKYEGGEDEKIVLYYHPFQFIQAHRLEGQLNNVINPMLLENLIEITREQLAEWKKNLAEDIDGWQKAMVNEWIGTVGIC